MRMDNSEKKAPFVRVRGIRFKTQDYIPIDLNCLRINSILDFNLYIAVDGEYVLYRAPSMNFTEKTRKSLIEHGRQYLFISRRERKVYQEYIESHLPDIIQDPGIDETAKSAIIYTSARMLVKDLMEKPSLPENMKRCVALVENTVLHLLKSQETFYHTLSIMPFDYSTYTHSVNVCIFSLALANKIGIQGKAELHTLGTGALLHDIGKSRVPKEVLEKRGPLTDAEMMIIQRHPQYGFEIIINSRVVPHDAHYPVLQHHERENGRGYPHHLLSKDIHRYSKIVAIADVFDAMTTQRSYRNALDAYPALREIYEDRDAFDCELLEQFTRLLGVASPEARRPLPQT